MDKYNITSFKSLFDNVGVLQRVSLKAFVNLIKDNPIRTKETQLQYQNGDKTFRDRCKDKGCYICGTSRLNRRRIGDILTRSMITLDLDYCRTDIFKILEEKAKEMGFYFFIYSTHSHTPDNPRLRLIVPLDKDVSPEIYSPIALGIAGKVGIEFFDATTYQINRPMHMSSVSIDGEYVFKEYNSIDNIVDSEKILSEYLDYLDINEFQKPIYIEGLKVKTIEDGGKVKSSTKTKYEIVNAFNIVYPITDAIDTFLNDVYEKSSIDRYTYIKGESKGGLCILNNEYAYSHHATDPAQSRLLSAFEIVRIHKFGNEDNNITEEEQRANYTKSESFKKMCEWIKNNCPKVFEKMPSVERMNENKNLFNNAKLDDIDVQNFEPKNLFPYLDYTGTGVNAHPSSSAKNICYILENDPFLKDLFYYDSLKESMCFDRTPGWNKNKNKGDVIGDDDDSQIRLYLNLTYQIVAKDVVADAVLHEAQLKRIHPIRSFLSNIEWDGKPRIETKICELFDVPINQFYREASKSWFCAIVQRILYPGCKYDMVLLLCGKQGIGKSAFGRSIATLYWGDKGIQSMDSQLNYFSDMEIPFGKKDAYEQLNGIMIYELSELEKYYKKNDVSAIKSYISATSDNYRKSYGRRNDTYKRQCVFIASTNDTQPLKDSTGNRRFLPFYSRLAEHTTRIYNEHYWSEDERNQCLAEAMHCITVEGFNPMTFSQEAHKEWSELGKKATTDNPKLPFVERYVNNQFPTNFLIYKDLMLMRRIWSQDIRQAYDSTERLVEINQRGQRDEFSIKEIKCVLFDCAIGDDRDYNLERDIINALLELGYEKSKERASQGIFGRQAIYTKTNSCCVYNRVKDISGEISVDDLF